MMQSTASRPAPAHQVALFKGAPRDYLNLGTLKIPYLVSYYIDESFHTTWVVRGRTKFKNLKGEDGLKFSISDHQFTLPKVEAVFISELPEYFKATGPGVDIILGRDFLTAYSFLFFKRAQGGLQLSRSCINRCKWPDKFDRPLDFYTAWYIDKMDKTKAGIAAFVNICSPFTTWRPYKPCYWDPKEDIGLCAMTQAMKTATQMPALDPGPVINIITNDEYAYKTYLPFLEIQHRDLSGTKNFQTLNPRLRDTVNRFLKYRKYYADRNGLNELLCVNMVYFRKQEYRKRYGSAKLEYAVQLAMLGAKMREFDTKDQLGLQLSNEHYYHFDNKTQVFAVPKIEVNKTLREILESYQQLNGTVPVGLSEYTPSSDETPIAGFTGENPPAPNPNVASEKKPLVPTPITIPNADKCATYSVEEAPINDPLEEEKSHSTLNFVPKIQKHAKHRHLVDFTLEEELEKMQQCGLSFPGLYSILDRLNSKDVTHSEKASILKETATQLQDLVKQSEEKGLAITELQRRNCDVIMAGARKQQEDLVIGAALAAKHFKGVVEGYFIREPADRALQGEIHPTNPTPIGLLSKRNTYLDPVNMNESTTSADARKRLDKHLLAVEMLKESGKLPRTSFLDDKIVAFDCHFTTPRGSLRGTAKANKNAEKLKMKAAKSKLDSAQAELAAAFSAIDLKFRENRRSNNGIFARATRNTEACEGFSKPPEPTTMRVLGGATWPSKTGRGQLLEPGSSGTASNRQGNHDRMASHPNSAAELNMDPKNIATEHRRPTQTSAQADTKIDMRKTPITPTTEKVGPNANGSSRKTPAGYPGGAIGLANIGGIPGDRYGNDWRHDNPAGEGRSSSFDEIYPPRSASGLKEPVLIPGTRKIGPEESVVSPTASQRTTGTIPITHGVPINLTAGGEESPLISRGITPKQLAEMTDLSPGGIQRSLNKPIGTLIDALVVSPELRKTTITAVNDTLGGSFLVEDEFARFLGLVEDQQVVALTA